MINRARILYQTAVGPSETVIAIEDIPHFLRKYRIISIEPFQKENEMKQEVIYLFSIGMSNGMVEVVRADNWNLNAGYFRFWKDGQEVVIYERDSVESIHSELQIEIRGE